MSLSVAFFRYTYEISKLARRQEVQLYKDIFVLWNGGVGTKFRFYSLGSNLI